jgi:hypothetical protein
MSDIPDPLGKVTEGKGFLDKVRKFLSGFVGYFDREQRREADKILRETIAQRYEEQWERISGLQRQLIEEGGIEHVDDLERAALKLRTFVDRVKGASHGYAGFFDHVGIGSDELERIYEYDLGMLESIEVVSNAIDNVEASFGSDGLPAALRHLEGRCEDVSKLFDRRDEVILAM